MKRVRILAAAGALACGWFGAVGCGGGEEEARPDSVQPMAPPGEAPAPPRAGAANGAPRIDAVRFDPAHPGVGETVRAIVEAEDPDGDHVRLSYAWSVEGKSVAGSQDRLQIDRQISRGATVELRVTASDGHTESDPFVVTTSVGNRPPRIGNLTIQPAGKITAAGPIMAIATGADPDGDAISFEYTWTVNGETSDERGAEFPDTELQRGDVVTVSVIARDEQGESAPLASPPIEVQNAAPVIRSQPNLDGADGVFAYQLVAEDPDGDRLRYGLGKVPEGMTVVPGSGEVSWTPREDQAGSHAVEIWAEDPQGARATQRFELTIATAGEPAMPPAAPAEAPAETPESDEASEPAEG